MVEIIVYLIASMLITSSVNAVEVDTEMISQAVSEPMALEEPKKEISIEGIEAEIQMEQVFIERTEAWIERLQNEEVDQRDRINELKTNLLEHQQRLTELEQMKKDRELQSTE